MSDSRAQVITEEVLLLNCQGRQRFVMTRTACHAPEAKRILRAIAKEGRGKVSPAVWQTLHDWATEALKHMAPAGSIEDES